MMVSAGQQNMRGRVGSTDLEMELADADDIQVRQEDHWDPGAVSCRLHPLFLPSSPQAVSVLQSPSKRRLIAFQLNI